MLRSTSSRLPVSRLQRWYRPVLLIATSLALLIVTLTVVALTSDSCSASTPLDSVGVPPYNGFLAGKLGADHCANTGRHLASLVLASARPPLLPANGSCSAAPPLSDRECPRTLTAEITRPLPKSRVPRPLLKSQIADRPKFQIAGRPKFQIPGPAKSLTASHGPVLPDSTDSSKDVWIAGLAVGALALAALAFTAIVRRVPTSTPTSTSPPAPLTSFVPTVPDLEEPFFVTDPRKALGNALFESLADLRPSLGSFDPVADDNASCIFDQVELDMLTHLGVRSTSDFARLVLLLPRPARACSLDLRRRGVMRRARRRRSFRRELTILNPSSVRVTARTQAKSPRTDR